MKIGKSVVGTTSMAHEASFSRKHKDLSTRLLKIVISIPPFSPATEASLRWDISFTTVAAVLRSFSSLFFSTKALHSSDKGMAFSVQAEEELPGIEFSKSKNILLPGASLASVESLSMPLASPCVETFEQVQEVVLSADIRCAQCQRRVADMMSRMKETESVVVNVLEKKVTLTCKYPGAVKLPSKQTPAIYRKPFNKIAMIKKIFRPSHG